jgi:excisionase family DNA binding protein
MNVHDPLVVYSNEPNTRAAFTIAETADLLGVSVDTVRNEIAAGRLRAVHLGGGQTVRIPAWSIQERLA